MVRATGLKSVWDTEAVLAAFNEAGVKQFHAYKLWNYLLRHPLASWADVPDLPKAAIQLLDKDFAKFTTKVVRCERSSDGETTKLLIQLQDGQQVESVIMQYDTRQQGLNNEAESCQQAASSHDMSYQQQQDSSTDDDEQEEFHSCPDSDSDYQDAVTITATDEQLSELNNYNAAGQGPASDATFHTHQELPQSSQQGISHEGTDHRPGSSVRVRPHNKMTSKSSKSMPGNVRSTLCVSSQIGCQMGCTFCATGTMGLKGNLTAGEIVEQLVHALSVTRIRNIVFMGMGEPLANYEAVRAAVRLMTDSRVFGLSKRHVTISTVGVVPRIKQLATDLPGVSLALSLHAPNQALRMQIVPSARAYPLDKLMQAVRQYEIDSKQRVFMEYVMLAGVNDGLQQAHELGSLLSQHNATLNLIPWNPVIAAASNEDAAKRGAGQPLAFAAPRNNDVVAFQAVVRDQYGVPTTIRQEKGQDISGACGQLVVMQQVAAAEKKLGTCSGSQQEQESTHQHACSVKPVTDIEDL